MADDDAGDDASLAAALAEREAAVDAFLRSGATADALRRALGAPPFASKDAALKDRSFAVVHRACAAIGARDEALAGFFSAIDADAADALMKCAAAAFRAAPRAARARVPLLMAAPPPLSRADIIRGLAKPDNSALYLRLHGLLVEKCGIACVVRAIVDRKTA